jgi:Flp pilus assembly protein TadD
MKWIALLLLCLVGAPALRAAGTDDEYLRIYGTMMEGDSLAKDGKWALAASQYGQAQSALQKLQAAHPDWDPEIVHFRLDYLSAQLADLAKMAPMAGVAAGPVSPPVTAPVDERDQRILVLQEQNRALTAANVELGNKVKEALSIQPAAISPGELARAEERIVELEKERDLLKVNSSQAKAPPESLPGPPPKALADAKTRTAELERQIAHLKGKTAALEKNLEAAQRQLAAQMKQLADAEAQGDAALLAARAQLREALRQRDDLAKKWAGAKVGGEDPNPSAQLAEPFRPIIPANSPPATGPAAPPAAVTNASPGHLAHTSKELPPGAGALMADAMRASMERDYAKAEQKYREILHQDENNVYVLAHLAEAQFAAGHLDDCEKTVLKALALDADDAASLYFLGILRYRQEKLDAALDALSRSAQLNPTNSSTQTYLGCVLDEKGNHAGAETALRKALELDPRSPEANYNLALVYATETPASPALARWHYERALALGHPRNPGLEKTLSAVTKTN